MYRSVFPEASEGMSVYKVACYILDFANNSIGIVNGKVLPVSSSTP